MNTAPQPSTQSPPTRFYAPDYRRKLRDAGAFRALSPAAHVVLSALCDRANPAGVAWPGVETIAREYNLGESTVRRALGELATLGLILVARRAGKVSRYALITPPALARTPLDSEGDPSQIGPPPLSNRAPNMITDHPNDHAKQHDNGERAEVVVVEEETTTQEFAAALPSAEGLEEAVDAGAIAMLAPDVVDRARALGLAPAKVNRYGTDRVRWVLDALDAERARRMIGNPAGWAMQALREHWDLPGAVVQPALPFAQAAANAARPPEGTGWARLQGEARAVEVQDVNDVRVLLVDGSVIPSHHWGAWEWLADYPNGVVDALCDVELSEGEDLVPDDAELSIEKRATLARLRLWASLRPRTDAELAVKIEALGVTADEWEAYQAAADWLDANG